MRDKSPQHNETPYSSVEKAVVSPVTGYHETPLPRLAALAEGALVSFKGKVAAVEADAYVVAADGASVKVMPQTVASATNPELKGRDVTVRGCLWKCNGEKRLAQEEIFGPVLAVMRAKDFGQALQWATSTRFALTGGVFSRSPNHLERSRREFRVGNLYINRGITGAIVGRQAFGGFRMSGVGSKAGGADYLLQFLDPRAITENTMRRGFVALP